MLACVALEAQIYYAMLCYVKDVEFLRPVLDINNKAVKGRERREPRGGHNNIKSRTGYFLAAHLLVAHSLGRSSV